MVGAALQMPIIIPEFENLYLMAEIATHSYTKWQKSRPIPIPDLKNCDPSKRHLRTRHFLGVNPREPQMEKRPKRLTILTKFTQNSTNLDIFEKCRTFVTKQSERRGQLAVSALSELHFYPHLVGHYWES